LDVSDAGTLVTSETTSGGLCTTVGGATYYYVIVAVNDNGATAYAGQDDVTVTTTVSTFTVSWNPVSGATGYRLYRDKDSDWTDAADDWVDGTTISAPTTSYIDDCSGDIASQTPPTTNTTGGTLYTSNISSNTPTVEFNRPISVDIAGDVEMAYDLYFSNTGLASITSEGPLKVSAGDPNHAENLTLATAGTGDIIIDIVDSNATYGGVKILGSDSGGYVFKIEPDGDVKIGGSGSGGSDLTVKENISLTGGNITKYILGRSCW